MLFTDLKVGEPIEVWSVNPDLEEAVMNVIRRVYDLGKAEESITEEVLAQLDEHTKSNKTINIHVSNMMKMQIDVIDVSLLRWEDIK